MAVMKSLVHKDLLPHAQASLDRLRELWHGRLYALRAANWAPISDDAVSLTYFRNCPPFGVKTDTTSKPCKRHLICPFCYGRMHVLRPFCKFEKVLYGSDTHYLGKDGHLLPVLRPDLKIVSFRCPTSGTNRVRRELTDTGLWDHWQVAKEFVRANRKIEVNGFGAEYASILFSVYPVQQSSRLGIVRSGVLLVPGGLPKSEVIAYRMGGGIVKQFEPSKEGLYRAHVHAFKYPNRMMTESPYLTARLLEHMHYARVATWYGPRGSKTAIEEDADGEGQE